MRHQTGCGSARLDPPLSTYAVQWSLNAPALEPNLMANPAPRRRHLLSDRPAPTADLPESADPVTDGVPVREVRAVFTEQTVTVYQAFSPRIAVPAIAIGRFAPPFKRERMTWIKPSLLWMAYRSDWATKPGQERVLSIEVTRAGFEWALSNACLSHFDPVLHESHEHWVNRLAESPVRIQWDPERSLTLKPLPYRTIQIGLGGEAVDRYVDEWIVDITDITEHLHRIEALVRAGNHDQARTLLPGEQPYALPTQTADRIGAADDRAAY